jgi:fatty acid CoA ligase FadD9
MSNEDNLVEMFGRAYQRLMAMAKTDPQLGQLVPIDAVTQAMQQPGLSYEGVIATVLAGYADRPALGTRAYEINTDQQTGRRIRQYLPAFKTITYRQLAGQIEAVANCWRHHPRHRLAPGEFVSFLSFTGAEMVAMDLACAYAQVISVPLQANLPQSDVIEIMNDTRPASLVASIDNLDLAVSYALQQESIRSLIVIDVEEADETETDRLTAARQQLLKDGGHVSLATFGEVVAYGKAHIWASLPKPDHGLDAVSMLMYTSGSTGTPKGAIIHEAICIRLWSGMARYQPTITLVYAPMNHFMGRSQVFTTLAQGGTAFFTLKIDMSTLFEDIRLVRPTSLQCMPRICEIIYQHYQSEVQRRAAKGGDMHAADRQIRDEMSKTYLGDRLVVGSTGSSPTAPEVQDFIKQCFDIAFAEGYGSTEAGGTATTHANRVQRTAGVLVIDYKLRDVPELGYYTTDKPYPRGELLVKTQLMIHGYFKRPEATAAIFDSDGYLITGDIMEERGPDHIVWVDRRNNVIKLSQAEYVAIGPLEVTYLSGSNLIQHIYVYGSSYRSFLLAVVVPDLSVANHRLGREPTVEELRAMVVADLQQTARVSNLKSFEVPRDVLIETEPFSLENGLLSSVRKPLRPKLKRRYGDQLEAMYREMDRKQERELAALRSGGATLSTLERVAGALKANLGLASIDVTNTQSYSDLGGDSLGAVSLTLLLKEIFDVPVPVTAILNPAGSAESLAKYIDNALTSNGEAGALTFAKIHGAASAVIQVSDLTLDRFLGAAALALAANAAPPAAAVRTVLLTGANGFLGRFLCLEWLERLAPVNGKVICIIRGANAAAARARLDEAFGTADPILIERFRTLAARHLQMIPGDLATPRLGLGETNFAQLAESVDQIVHPAALVNHMLSYENLFEPNVVGTAELIRLALTTRQKRFDYVSSVAVPHVDPRLTQGGESMDVRKGPESIPLSSSYASGYAASKWAGEVLLRDAHERFGLPVNVFRADMILPHSRFKGQINVPDMITRLLFSLVMTGIAPESFYELEADGGRPRAHYDGLPVDFISAAMQQIGGRPHYDFKTYNIINMHHDDGISLDSIVDWVISAGYPIQRVEGHADWLQRFADKLRHLPDAQRQHSSLTILGHFARPHPAHPTPLTSENFVAAVRGIPAGPTVPHLSEAFIHKYLDDMRELGLLPAVARAAVA